jgi:hypothetical protein
MEGDLRVPWLRYIDGEVRDALRRGVRIKGICLYPILGHPGWDDHRYCPNGLFEMDPHQAGRRPVHASLAAELNWQQRLLAIQFRKPAAKPGGPSPGTPWPSASLDSTGPEWPSP